MIGINYAICTGSIARTVDLQSSVLQLGYGYPLNIIHSYIPAVIQYYKETTEILQFYSLVNIH